MAFDRALDFESLLKREFRGLWAWRIDGPFAQLMNNAEVDVALLHWNQLARKSFYVKLASTITLLPNKVICLVKKESGE
jgi:hypothetical protein